MFATGAVLTSKRSKAAVAESMVGLVPMLAIDEWHIERWYKTAGEIPAEQVLKAHIFFIADDQYVISKEGTFENDLEFDLRLKATLQRHSDKPVAVVKIHY